TACEPAIVSPPRSAREREEMENWSSRRIRELTPEIALRGMAANKLFRNAAKSFATQSGPKRKEPLDNASGPDGPYLPTRWRCGKPIALLCADHSRLPL